MAQLSRIPYYPETGYYPDGAMEWHKTKHGDGFIIKFYHPEGNIRDSIYFLDGKPVGEAKSWYQNGQLRTWFFYENGEHDYSFKHYHKSGGALRLTGQIKNSKRFGPYIIYTSRGEVKYLSDFNKGKIVALRDKYANGKHLKDLSYRKQIKKKKVILSNSSGDKRSLKRGALVSLRLADTNVTNCRVDGFIGDSMVISKFKYDLSGSRHTLEYDTTVKLSLEDVVEVYHIRNNMDRKEFGCLLLGVTGSVIFVESLVLAPFLFGPEVYLEPEYYFVISSGFYAMRAGMRASWKLQTKRYSKLTY